MWVEIVAIQSWKTIAIHRNIITAAHHSKCGSEGVDTRYRDHITDRYSEKRLRKDQRHPFVLEWLSHICRASRLPVRTVHKYVCMFTRVSQARCISSSSREDIAGISAHRNSPLIRKFRSRTGPQTIVLAPPRRHGNCIWPSFIFQTCRDFGGRRLFKMPVLGLWNWTKPVHWISYTNPGFFDRFWLNCFNSVNKHEVI